MGELERHQPRDWREPVRLATDKNRKMTANKATRISASAMAEVLSALNEYWDALEATDLKERSKGIYMSMADNFVRWMRDEFIPGRRTTVHSYQPQRPKRFQGIKNSDDAPDVCRCGHPSESHIYPGSAQYGDCHHCECELYDPAGGIKGLPIHPLFSFTEGEFRMVSCTQCGRFRVAPDGVCEKCGWDNDNDGPVEQTRPQFCQHSPTKMHEIPSLSSNHCRYCLRAIKASPRAHGTHERWEAGCDCNDCRGAMRQWITLSSGLPSSLAATLRDILAFRRNVNELWLPTSTLKKNAARRQNLEELVHVGVLTKINNESNHPSTYLLHVERLRVQDTTG